MTGTQMAFDLPGHPALGRGDFFVSPANAAAVEAVQTWHDWPLGKLVLVGPEGAGKTHLAHVWAALVEAQIVDAREIGPRVEALAQATAIGPVVVEDADAVAGDRGAEEALFHLHNLALAEGAPLLVTAKSPPARWGLTLPDLKSRMQGSALVSLSGPDDALLTAVLVKQFADRQAPVDPEVVPYLVARMDRSFAEVRRLVAALDQEALAGRRRITKPLAGKVLAALGTEG